MTNIRRALEAAAAGGSAYVLWMWGEGDMGRLGIGNTTDYSSPKQVGDAGLWATEDFLKVSMGSNHTMVVKPDGSLWGWGDANDGKMGTGNLTDVSNAVQIGALTDWGVVSAGGGNKTLAVKTDGTLWSWGSGGRGQLGLGNATAYSSPKQVGGLTNWSSNSAHLSASYSASASTSFAIKTDGTLWAWGYNNKGQLGLGNTTNYSSPKQVGALTTWAFVFSGKAQSAAIKTDGTLWTWGNGGKGVLGLNNKLNYSSPKQVGALTNWSSIAIGNYNRLAVKTDGTLWAWGYGWYGRLGLGNQTGYSSPKQIGALTNWLKASANDQAASRAIKTDGTLWVWGRNQKGQLGLGNTTDISSPQQLGSLTTWIDVGGGNQSSMGITSV